MIPMASGAHHVPLRVQPVPRQDKPETARRKGLNVGEHLKAAYTSHPPRVIYNALTGKPPIVRKPVFEGTLKEPGDVVFEGGKAAKWWKK